MDLHNRIETDVARTQATPLTTYIGDYLIACESGSGMKRALRPKTIAGYRGSLAELDALLGRPSLAGFTEGAVSEVVKGKRKRSKANARLIAATAKTFSTWLAEKGHTEDNRLEDMATPVFNGRRHAFSDIEFRKILSALSGMPTHNRRRDRAIVLLGFSAGPRLGEMYALRLRDFHLERPLAQSWVHLQWDTTKTQHDRMMVISEDAASALYEYISISRPETGPDAPLFLKSNGEPYAEGGWEKVLRSISRRLAEDGIKGFNAHRMRHQWATMAARTGMTAAEMRAQGGWARGSRVIDNYIDEIPLEDMQRRGSPMTTFLRRVV